MHYLKRLSVNRREEAIYKFKMNIELLRLNLPNFDFRLSSEREYVRIFDIYRNKFVKLTPEEWVRQNFVRYLNESLGYPKSRTKIEHNLKYGPLRKRCDIIIFDKKGLPYLLVECKSPNVELSQSVVNQLAMYNSQFKCEFISITNGLLHYHFKYDADSFNYNAVAEIPEYEKTI